MDLDHCNARLAVLASCAPAHTLTVLVADDGRPHGVQLWDLLVEAALLDPDRDPDAEFGPDGPADVETALCYQVGPVADDGRSEGIVSALTSIFGDSTTIRTGPHSIVVDEIIGLLGRDARWLSNTDLSDDHDQSWVPVTDAECDTAIVGRGNGWLFAVVATE